jgi:hypothetical protein
MSYDNLFSFGQPKATTASWMPAPAVKQVPYAGSTMSSTPDFAANYGLGTSTDVMGGLGFKAPGFSSNGLGNTGLGTSGGLGGSSMFDNLSSFGKNFFGTSKDPGYGSMGIGLGLNLMGLMQSRQGLKATKEQNAFARAAHTQALDNQKQDYMNQLSRYAEASAADRGLARDSDERKQFVDRYVEDKRMKA